MFFPNRPLQSLPAIARARPLLLRLLLGSLFLSAAPAAAAPEEVSPFRVEQDLYMLLAGGQGIGQERTIVPGDVIMRTRIGYSALARLEAPVSVMLATVPIDLATSPALPEVRPLGSTRDRVGRDARIFCGAQRRPDNIAGPPPRPHPTGRRFDKYVMPCLVDGDRDGRVEAAFLVGAHWPSEIQLVPIPPVAYREATNIPIPASDAWVTFEKGAMLQGPVLELHARFFGNIMPIRAVRLGEEKDFFPIQRSVKRETYPFVVRYGAAAISLLGYEPEGRRLRIRVDSPFDTTALRFEYLGPTVITIYH